MSAYVVADETINKIVSYLYLKEKGDRSYWPNRVLAEADYDMANEELADQLAQDMFALNVRAVNERYGDGEAEEFRPLDFRYHLELATKEMWAFKLLGSWLYQCSEGTVPQTELYKLMREVQHWIAVSIVHSLEAYEKAPWGH